MNRKKFTRAAKIATASLVAFTMTTSPVFAATGDLWKGTTNKGSVAQMILGGSAGRLDFAANMGQYTYEVDGVGYAVGEVDTMFKANPTLSTAEVQAKVKAELTGTPVSDELVVESVSAINTTTIEVTFSDGVTQQFTVEPLQVGNNVRTVEYEGNSFQVTVVIEDVAKAAVSDIKFHNYRHISVEFNTLVDEATATDPANYYFEILDGEVAADTFGANALGLYNQLSDIETATTLVGGWWAPAYNHITAKAVNGKTVVDIKLPEDARFTNLVDEESVTDAEQTLHVELADGSLKALIKNTNVSVAVRNVKQFNGTRGIDTFVKPIKILDEKRPELTVAYKVEGANQESVSLNNPVALKSDGSDKILLGFDEPVFDAHGLETSTERDVKVYINGKLAASTKDGDLAGILDFAMSENDTYDVARHATLDVEAAAVKVSERYQEDDILNVKVIGVTDLAGNIMVPSTIEFNVKVVDPEVADPVVDPATKPAAKEIVQIADNMFRVAWNVPNATGQFIIENGDGEGGAITVNTTLSAANPLIGVDFYSYVEVAATVDSDPSDDPAADDDDILAYDGQDFINRVVKINNPFVVNGAGDEYLVKGNNKNFGLMKIQKDIYAPIALQPIDLDYNAASNTIVLNVEDVVPNGVAQDYMHEVLALTYAYSAGDFDRNAAGVDTPDATHDYLPVRVSYKTADGALRSALVTNKTVPGSSYGGTGTITGVPGSIAYNAANLTLDLSGYPTLLDQDGALVGGAEYKVELPKGFFADSAQDIAAGAGEEMVIAFTGTVPTDNLATMTAGDAATVGDGIGDILYVSNARSADYGYTSTAHTVVQKVKAKPDAPGAVGADTVPQTSKALIVFDSSKNEVTIEFKGTIKLDTLKNPNNYMLNGKTLKAWGLTANDIEYLQEYNGTDVVAQYAIFKVPTDSVPANGDVELRVYGVTNEAGGMMAEVVTDVYLLDTTRPMVLDAVVAGQRQIILTFDEPIVHREGQSPIAAAKNFSVKAGTTTLTVLEARVADRAVTLDLGSDIPDSGNIIVKIVEDASGNILIIDGSQNKNPLNSDNDISVRRN
ncbi:MAG: SwmB domain-containing protein [Desulfitobacterium hafniense]|uniref:SwmB domain-containing protein n=1 Tax=Desulfitobacterium hafniense TaxID=49338 RepID=UPI002B1FE67C|nr:SwmB domain-containing protein [Desulfitobacterium hafniense]MEA5024016.1 SwmB domain-containing protein [Desulfitobacterium hafniense]